MLGDSSGPDPDTSSVSPPPGEAAEQPRSHSWLFLLLTFVFAGSIPAILILPGLRSDPPKTTETETESPQAAIAIRPVEDQRIDELATMTVTVEVDAPADYETVRFRLVDPPDGAEIDAVTGRLVWTPTEEQGPADTQLKVSAHASGREVAATTFNVSVNEVNRPPAIAPVDDQRIALGESLDLAVSAKDLDLPRQQLEYALTPGAPVGAKIDPLRGKITWNTSGAAAGTTFRFEVRVTDAQSATSAATTRFDVRILPPATVSVASNTPSTDPTGKVAVGKPDPAPLPKQPGPAPIAKTTPKTLPLPKPATRPMPDDGGAGSEPQKPKDPDEQIVELFKSRVRKGNLLDREAYAKLRKIHCDKFEKQHAATIQRAYGADFDAMTKWLDEHAAIKEEFYTAIKPRFDDVTAALAMMNALRKQFPDHVTTYPNVAIALSVTWDSAGRGVYDYEHHARRTKSDMSDGLVGAIENFQYLLQLETVTPKRVAFLPWEFVTLLVNHKTPLAERKWAVQNYVGKRQMFGKCYHDVPYDNLMLDTKSAEAKLNGKPYTLPAIRKFGGVCAMQADFAARVGKSIGVPAAYVRGPSASGGHHAWVMWVELTGVSRSSIQFSLQSHGRYRGDKYYVGTLHDPQTSQQITDRQLELRLQAIGMDPIARRHAALIMKSYPMLRDKTQMDTTQQLAFLNDVIKLSPGNEDAWRTVAQLSRDGQITGKLADSMIDVLNALFITFRNVPDFTWEIFDDLIAYQDVPAQRYQLYARLAALYEAAERPDLSCEARLKFATYLVADKQYGAAINGLAQTIMRFPDEGRYVPQMLDRLESICDLAGGKDQQLSGFYKAFLPKVPPSRNGRPSPYAIKMFERGITHFKSRGDLQTAQALSGQLAKIKSGTGKKKK